MAGLHEFATLDALGVGIGRGGRHDETRAARVLEVGVEVINPEIVGTACGHFFLLVRLRCAKRQATGVQSLCVLHLIHVKGRVGGHKVTLAVERVRIVVEGVGVIARLDVALHAVNSHVHETKLGVVVDLLLSVEHHGLSGVVTLLAHVVAGGNEHATRAASRIEHLATRGLDDVHDHADERLGRKEDAVVACHRWSKLAEEVLVDAADDIIALLVEGRVVEDADNAAQQVIAKVSVGVRKDARERGVNGSDTCHGFVDRFADVGTIGQVEQVVIAGLLGDEHRAFGGVVRCLLGRFATRDSGTLSFDLLVGALETTPCIAQEDEAQNRHAVLLARQLGVGT